MYIKKYLFPVFILLLCNTMHAQKYIYNGSIGRFSNATAFSFSPSGFIYVADDDYDEIIMLDTLGNVLKNVSDFGWGSSSYFTPSSVYCSNTFIVYVSDFYNDKIYKLDKDLNILTSIEGASLIGADVTFARPVGVVTSDFGDLFILDSEFKRVLKFDYFGNYSMNFGGYDRGLNAVTNPEGLAVSEDQMLIILDNNSLLIYDTFGNSFGKYPQYEDFNSINAYGRVMTLTSRDKVFINRSSADKTGFRETELIEAPDTDFFISALEFNGKLYILTRREIHLFDRL